MAGISWYLGQALLNHVTKVATYSTPATLALALSLGSPNSQSMSEVGTGSGYSASTVSFSSASTPASSATTTNISAVTFGSFSSPATLSGCFLKDSIANSGTGNPLMFGLLATARTLASGDTLVFASGALTATLV